MGLMKASQAQRAKCFLKRKRKAASERKVSQVEAPEAAVIQASKQRGDQDTPELSARRGRRCLPHVKKVDDIPIAKKDIPKLAGHHRKRKKIGTARSDRDPIRNVFAHNQPPKPPAHGRKRKASNHPKPVAEGPAKDLFVVEAFVGDFAAKDWEVPFRVVGIQRVVGPITINIASSSDEGSVVETIFDAKDRRSEKFSFRALGPENQVRVVSGRLVVGWRPADTRVEVTDEKMHRFLCEKYGDGASCMDQTKLTFAYCGEDTFEITSSGGTSLQSASGTVGYGKDAEGYAIRPRWVHLAEKQFSENLADPAFAACEKVARQIVEGVVYDWKKGYGRKVKYHYPKKPRAVCSGFADHVVSYFRASTPEGSAARSFIAEIRKLGDSDHAWNEIVLRDGRILYFDATWFQGQSVDAEGFVVDEPRYNAIDLTFDREVFETNGYARSVQTDRIMQVHRGRVTKVVKIPIEQPKVHEMPVALLVDDESDDPFHTSDAQTGEGWASNSGTVST